MCTRLYVNQRHIMCVHRIDNSTMCVTQTLMCLNQQSTEVCFGGLGKQVWFVCVA